MSLKTEVFWRTMKMSSQFTRNCKCFIFKYNLTKKQVPLFSHTETMAEWLILGGLWGVGWVMGGLWGVFGSEGSGWSFWGGQGMCGVPAPITQVGDTEDHPKMGREHKGFFPQIDCTAEIMKWHQNYLQKNEEGCRNDISISLFWWGCCWQAFQWRVTSTQVRRNFCLGQH